MITLHRASSILLLNALLIAGSYSMATATEVALGSATEGAVARAERNIIIEPVQAQPMPPLPPAGDIPALKPSQASKATTGAVKSKDKPQNPSVVTGGTLKDVRKKQQEELFGQLRKASTPESSHAIASRLRQSFARTGSDSLDAMLRWAETALNQSREAEAQDFIDEVMARNPDNATVWQLRSRLHLRRNELAGAISDIRQAMILEPRNFDVLINYATLLRETGNEKGALRLYEQALTVYPMMKEAQDELLRLTEANSEIAL